MTSPSPAYKVCAVPFCTSTTIKTPEKLFIHVPQKLEFRQKWLELAGRNLATVSPKYSMFFCEDHFELPKDMENFMEFKLMGAVGKIRMRPHCLPSKFVCQQDQRKRVSTSMTTSPLSKKEKTMCTTEIEDLGVPSTSGRTLHLGVPVTPLLLVMEENSCSSICFEAVNVKNEPVYGFNEQVHVKEEVLECLKEEAAWEDSAAAGEAAALAGAAAGEEAVLAGAAAGEAAPLAGAAEGEAAALASLYAGHEVKEELVLGPEVLQPRDVAFTLYGLSARARGCYPDHTYAKAECPPEVLARAGGQRGGRGSAGKYGHCCRACNNTFKSSRLLKIHKRTHKGERLYSCGTCNKKFTQFSNLKMHERTHTGEKPFSCGICQKKFTQLGGLKEHERIHTGERPFACGICKRKFTTSGTLKTHERTHTGERPYSCRTCNKRFSKLSNLKLHERTHTEKPFSCGICQKKFTQLGGLKKHERTHTGERPFPCGICKRKFTTSSHLKRHERMHTGERPYSCRTCNKKFTQLGSLKAHERMHTEEKPPTCDVCKKRFTLLRSLKIHKNRFHADRKPFCCDICQKRFAQKTTLVGHIRRHMAATPR